jgi:hypothetical protein
MLRENEKRSVIRHPYGEPLEFQLRRIQSATGQLIRGEGGGLDISTKGLGLITDIPLTTGEIIKLSLPSHPDRIPVPVLCQVRWVKLEGGKYRAGVLFIS